MQEANSTKQIFDKERNGQIWKEEMWMTNNRYFSEKTIMCIIKYRCRYIISPTKLGKNSLQKFNEKQWAMRI